MNRIRLQSLFWLCVFFLFGCSWQAQAKGEEDLTPPLKTSVGYSDLYKVEKWKHKAQKKGKDSKKQKFYMKAAQLGDYESQVKLGYYYAFGTWFPEFVDVEDDPIYVDNQHIVTDYRVQRKNEEVARYYLNKACQSNDEHHEQASLGLIYLSLDSIQYKEVAKRIWETLVFDCAIGMGMYLEDEPQTHLWPYERWKALHNTGRLLAMMSMYGIGTERDLLSAHYYSSWISNSLNMPNADPNNEFSSRIVKLAGALPYSEETKEYGCGLVSAMLLKRAVDLYEGNKSNREIRFWLERALETDSTNSKAYYFAGNLYANGEAGLPKRLNKAKEWLEKAVQFGSKEGEAALAVIEEMEEAEEQRRREMDAAERRAEEARRQQRRQAWAQAVGAIVQAAGNAYLQTQGYTPAYNASLLDPNLAVSQVQSQYAQMEALRQMSLQSIQMPQFDFNWPTTPAFTVDWNAVDWDSVPTMDAYYQFQGDLMNNGAGTTVESNTGNSSYTNMGSSYEKTCHLCHGTKKCWTCGGNGNYINPLTGDRVACPNCTDGWCSKCHGTGKL